MKGEYPPMPAARGSDVSDPELPSELIRPSCKQIGSDNTV